MLGEEGEAAFADAAAGLVEFLFEEGLGAVGFPAGGAAVFGRQGAEGAEDGGEAAAAAQESDAPFFEGVFGGEAREFPQGVALRPTEVCDELR